jgi:hypothetical protein
MIIGIETLNILEVVSFLLCESILFLGAQCTVKFCYLQLVNDVCCDCNQLLWFGSFSDNLD